jgi:hypothetical protein
LVEVDSPGGIPEEFIARGFFLEGSEVDETVDVLIFDVLHGAKNIQFISIPNSNL